MPRHYALKIQDKYDKGWRKEAGKLGQMWDVYRDDALILSNVLYIVTKWNKSEDIEAEKGTNFYRVRGSRQKLQIGDQFVGKDPATKREQSSLLERYTIISMRLLRDNIAIRSEWACRFYRPQMDADPGDVINPYSEQTVLLNSLVLTRDPTTHIWSWVPNEGSLTAGTIVWCDIQSALPKDFAIPIPTPTTTTAQGWTISCGLFNGEDLAERDIIVDSDNNWYRIQRKDMQFAGASLYQLRVSRLTI